MKKIISSFLALMISCNLFGHEGHADSSAKSQHGGIIKKSTNFYAEVLEDESSWVVYVMDHSYKVISPKEVHPTATMETKNGKKDLKLVLVKDHYEFKIDLKNEKYFKLNLILKKKAEVEKIVFNLEPQN